MTFVPIMWIVWSAIVVVMVGLHVYRSRLEKDEEDQIFLDDSFEHERNAQAVIVARANRVEPYVKLSDWLVAAMSAIIIVYYVHDFLVHLNVIR